MLLDLSVELSLVPLLPLSSSSLRTSRWLSTESWNSARGGKGPQRCSRSLKPRLVPSLKPLWLHGQGLTCEQNKPQSEAPSPSPATPSHSWHGRMIYPCSPFPIGTGSAPGLGAARACCPIPPSPPRGPGSPFRGRESLLRVGRMRRRGLGEPLQRGCSGAHGSLCSSAAPAEHLHQAAAECSPLQQSRAAKSPCRGRVLGGGALHSPQPCRLGQQSRLGSLCIEAIPISPGWQ